MAVEIVTKEDLEKFQNDLFKKLEEVFDVNLDLSKKWLKSSEVIRLLKISNSTLQVMRDTGVMPFTKFGSTIFYDRDEIHKIMESNRINTNQ